MVRYPSAALITRALRPWSAREMSITSCGAASPRLISGIKLCPPAITFASSPCRRSRSLASARRSARSKRNGLVNITFPPPTMLETSSRGEQAFLGSRNRVDQPCDESAEVWLEARRRCERRVPAWLQPEHGDRVLLGHLLQVFIRDANVEQRREQHPQALWMRRAGELAKVRTQDQVLPAQGCDPLGQLPRLLLPEDGRHARAGHIFHRRALGDQLSLHIQVQLAQRPVRMSHDEPGHARLYGGVLQRADLGQGQVPSRQRDAVVGHDLADGPRVLGEGAAVFLEDCHARAGKLLLGPPELRVIGHVEELGMVFRVVGRHPDDLGAVMNRCLGDVGIQAADRPVEHHRAERLHLRVHPVDVVGPPGGGCVVVLQHEAAHAVRGRVLGQRRIVDVPFEQGRCCVRVGVDRAAQKLEIWPVHDGSSSRQVRYPLGTWYRDASMWCATATGREAQVPERSAVTEPRPAFQVLERTFRILEVFSESRPEWSTTDISRALGLPVPTVHRILGALKRLGYVSQHEDTRRFRLGSAALDLGERARAVADLRPVAIGPLRRLSEATGETALLTVLTPERDRSVCLERVETPQPLRLSVQPGRQLPLHAGASQKALLAFMPEEEIEKLITQPLMRVCQSTITDPRALRRELKAISARGWASSYDDTDVVCAVGIAGPSARLTVERVRRDVRLVHAAALDIGRALGLTSPPVVASNARIGPAASRGHRAPAAVGGGADQ